MLFIEQKYAFMFLSNHAFDFHLVGDKAGKTFTLTRFLITIEMLMFVIF